MSAHRRFTVKVPPVHRCGICHKMITEVPVDVEPRYARHCMECRESIARQESDPEPWVDRGNRGGARLGFDYIIR